MTENLLFGLAIIISIGIFAQWISWQFKIPSILLLLIFGFIIGPFTGFLNPDEVFGELLFPLISFSVAIILFEGGLSLKINELKSIFGIVRNLITIGSLVTWISVTISAYYFANLSLGLSLLLGAILVVTGPTVIMPLLRLVKPKGQINAILKWEGIVNDPIGALLALLVFETIIASNFAEATLSIVFIVVKTILISSLIGVVGGYLLVILIRKDLIPDYLQNPATLAILFLVYAVSNTIQNESGLFSVTLMGIYLANQKQIVIEHIIEFKENLGVLLLSVLFIVLAARLNLSDLKLIDEKVIIFLIILILVVRPLSIFLSSIGTNISWKEKLYLSWMAPRGIVAAAVASIFSIELIHHGYDDGKLLVPIMFLVIIATILIYGLSAIPLARILKLSDPNPQGLLIAGVNKLSTEIYHALTNLKFKVILIDKNWEKVNIARKSGINALFGSIVSEKTLEEINLDGIGKLIALTSNKGINSLATIIYSKVFDSANVFQINTTPKINQEVTKDLRGFFISSEKLNYQLMEENEKDLKIKTHKITQEFQFNDILEKYASFQIFPLFIVTPNNKLIVYSEKTTTEPTVGDTLVSLIINSTEE